MSSKVFTWGVMGAVAAILMASPGLTQNADEEIPAVGPVDDEVAAPAVVETPVEMPAEAPDKPAQPEPVAADEDLFAPIVVPPAAQPTAPLANIPSAPEPEAPAPATEPVEPVAESPAQAQPFTLEQEAEAVRRLAEQTVVRLREQEIRGKKALADAQMAMTRRQYKEAMALFQKALEALPVRPQNEADRAEANRGLSEAQFQVIQELIRADQLQEALDLAMAANKRDPAHRGIERQLSAIQEELKRQKEREEQEAARVARDVTRSPEIQKRREEVNRLIREGRGFLAIGDTKRAADRFTSALSIDPENKEALRYLERTGEQAMKIRTVERSATSAQMLADVRGAWNPGDYTYVAPPPPSARGTRRRAGLCTDRKDGKDHYPTDRIPSGQHQRRRRFFGQGKHRGRHHHGRSGKERGQYHLEPGAGNRRAGCGSTNGAGRSLWRRRGRSRDAHGAWGSRDYLFSAVYFALFRAEDHHVGGQSEVSD